MIKPISIAGTVSIVLVLSLTLVPLAVVASYGGFGALTSNDVGAIRFTVTQALVSAAISVFFAVPIARALARRDFPGKSLVITLLGAPFLLPVIVAILGLVAVFGRQGWVNDGLRFLSLPEVSIYGFQGVILAHVFFNLPLCVRLILGGWQTVPRDRMRLAQSLGAGPWAFFKLIEWPVLRGTVPGAFLLVFLLCLTSFAVVLALGGGPRATSIELAIYQAFRFEFDLPHAAILGVWQFGICILVACAALIIPLPETGLTGLGRQQRVSYMQNRHVLDSLFIIVGMAFLLGPLIAVISNGTPHVFGLPSSVWAAMWNSLLIALGSSVLCLVMALSISVVLVRASALANRLGEGFAILSLVTSPLVIGTGLFLMIFPFARPGDFAIAVTFLVNAVFALPFFVRILKSPVEQLYRDYGQLSTNLGMGSWTWARWVALPALKPMLGFGAGLTAALSIGDLGVIALFAPPNVETLPLAMYRLMGAYKMDLAAGAGVLLLGISLLVFYLCDRGGRVGA